MWIVYDHHMHTEYYRGDWEEALHYAACKHWPNTKVVATGDADSAGCIPLYVNGGLYPALYLAPGPQSSRFGLSEGTALWNKEHA